MMERDAQASATGMGWKKDALALALLLALVLPLRLWLLGSAVATARDGIGYIRYALEFEQLSWRRVIDKNHQHPGYPLALLMVSEPVRWATGETDAPTMQFAGQLTSMLAALLLLYPMYHLGRILFNRRVGIGAALLFQYFPASGHHLSDGISEPLFLLLVAATLLQAVRALHGGSVARFALCGMFTGLAYLTRPEGAMIGMAVVPVLCASQFRPDWRESPWPAGLPASAAALILLAVWRSPGCTCTSQAGRRTEVERAAGYRIHRDALFQTARGGGRRWTAVCDELHAVEPIHRPASAQHARADVGD